MWHVGGTVVGAAPFLVLRGESLIIVVAGSPAHLLVRPILALPSSTSPAFTDP